MKDMQSLIVGDISKNISNHSFAIREEVCKLILTKYKPSEVERVVSSLCNEFVLISNGEVIARIEEDLSVAFDKETLTHKATLKVTPWISPLLL